MLNKILVRIFALLLIILLAEFIFFIYFYRSYYQNKNKDSSSINYLNQTAYEKVLKENADWLSNKFKELSIVEQNFYRNLFSLNYPNSFYSDLTLYNKLEGWVYNISTQSGQFNPAIDYVFKFDFETGDKTKKFPIYYNRDDLTKLKIKDKNNKILTIYDIKNGDFVTVEETYNLKKFNLINATITIH